MMMHIRQLKYFLFIIGFVLFIIFLGHFELPGPNKKVAKITNSSQKRLEVDLHKLDKSRLMVALAFGQSNSANYGNQHNLSQGNVFNFYQGKLFYAQDPMLGADGKGGSVWPILGDLLIENDRYSTVIFATIGVSGSEISRWTPSGDLYPTLNNTIQSLHNKGLTITHILWHQGETDAILNTSQKQYVKHFNDIKNAIKSSGIKAPFYVSIASRSREGLVNSNIQNAQIELIKTSQDIFPGPNTDQLDKKYRYDGIHFSAYGMSKTAQLWFHSIERSKPKK